MSVFNNALDSLAGVFAAADRGLYALPESVVQLRRAVRRLQDAHRGGGVPADQVMRRLADDACAAALDDGPLPSAAAALTALDDERAAAALYASVTVALERLQDRLNMTTRTMQTEPLYESLNDKLRALLAEVAEAARTLDDVDDVEDLIGGSDEQRRAWLALPALASRYAVLREAQRALDALRPPQRDRRGEYFEFRSPPTEPENEPSDPRKRLLWIIANPELEPWIPTPVQRDLRWTEARQPVGADQS